MKCDQQTAASVASTPVEAEVAVIFAEALTLEHVGIDEDFFDLGGDSRKAALVIVDVANRIGISVPLQGLFEARTVRKFCQRIEFLPRWKIR